MENFFSTQTTCAHLCNLWQEQNFKGINNDQQNSTYSLVTVNCCFLFTFFG